MKMTITIDGCPYEEREPLHYFANALEYASAIHDVREAIRSRRKWGDNVSDDEDKFLEELWDLLPSDPY